MIERDARRRFRFASRQSPAAERLLGRRDDLDSVVLVESGKVYRKSTVALRIARHLDGAWPLFAAFLVLPRFLRDFVYDGIGRRRYRMFGKRDACWVPNAELAERLLG